MRHPDIALLKSLVALVEEQHVSRAAERVGVTQSAMSYSLARLREYFDDPILQRSSSGMSATPEARLIIDRLRPALGEIDRILHEDRGFDPRTSSPKFRIASSGYVAAILMPQLVHELLSESPGCTVDVVPSAPSETKVRLENNEIDLAIGFWISLSENLMTKTLFDEELELIMSTSNRKDGPLRLSLEELCKRSFATHTTTEGGLVNYECVFDEYLSRSDHERRIGFRTPNIQVVPTVVTTTGMVAVLPARTAQSAYRNYPVRRVEVPEPLPTFSVSATWHARNKDAEHHKWLRHIIERVGKNIRQAQKS